MFDVVRFIFTQFNDETTLVLLLLLLIVGSLFVAYWIHNKRRFNKLLHQIPATVVNSYLDSIIQNSQALKSSLFRSDSASIPSIVPVGQLQGSAMSSGVSAEVLNQKNAEIASLHSSINEKSSVIRELEEQVLKFQSGSSGGGSGAGADVAVYQKRISELETEVLRLKEQLKQQSGKGDVAELTKERDALKEKLQEYEIIEDDLANLKKLQQENEDLKKQLAALQGGAKPVVAAPPPPPPEPVVAEVAPEPTPAEAPVVAEGGGEDKSAEDLLSEFERMLG